MIGRSGFGETSGQRCFQPRAAVPVLITAALLTLSPGWSGVAEADSFTDDRSITWDSIRDDTRAFFSNVLFGGVDENNDGAIGDDERLNANTFRFAVAGAVLVGLTGGLLGSFVTLRRMALFGDMLGHAVLPGVAVGFVIAGTKNTTALLLGALGAGLLAAVLTRVVPSFSRVKEDAALGISLSLFYALGIWLLAWITRNPELSVEASGLDRYLFGNPAVVQAVDAWYLLVAAITVFATIAVFFKEFLVCTFDRSFAASIGVPLAAADTVLIVLVTIVVVVSIKILGVVLVSAMLTIPAATSYLLCVRFAKMCAVSAFLGASAGFAGTYFSTVFDVGTGPSIVCTSFSMLVLVFLFSPQSGIAREYVRHRRHSLRTVRENLLAAAFRVQESDPALGRTIPLARIAELRRETVAETREIAKKLLGSGWAEIDDSESSSGGALVLSPNGESRARRVVRTHRLWEIFLSREASLPADHVHPGAEEIEHYFDDHETDELDRLLDHPETDPHGRRIPDSSASLNEDSREEPTPPSGRTAPEGDPK